MTWHQYQELYLVKYVTDGDFIVISEQAYNLPYNPPYNMLLRDIIEI